MNDDSPITGTQDQKDVAVLKIRSALVYCSAANDIDASFYEQTRTLVKLLVKDGIEIVYGGGSTGLMGEVSRTAMQSGGRVIGIAPTMFTPESLDHNITRLLRCQTMHERKAQMLSLSDCIIALPGGIGTLDELAEALCWRKLNTTYQRPVIIVNMNGFYDELLTFLDKMVKSGMLKMQEGFWHVITNPEDIITAIKHVEEIEKHRLKAMSEAEKAKAVIRT